ncbi:MAG: DNA polymerase III subunit alpha [Acidimicrobiia bacterium]|nr:DNA polymerase III subunit alpha [Acidimicrobiia bacterium]
MADSFVHLHVHSEFSMLDGASRLSELVTSVAMDGQPGVAVTDHGNMYGAFEFFKEARATGVKPIFGTEAYVATTGSRHDKAVSSGDNYHLTVLAETKTGYRNLMYIASMAFIEGFSYKPRVDLELLEERREGLIVTTGCLGSEVCQHLLADDYDGALKTASTYQDVFGRENYFVEVQDHGLPEDRIVVPQLVDIARAIDAPLLATNDSHYTDHDDAQAHDALLCVQTASQLADPDRFKFKTDQFWVKSAEEMRHLFRDLPEACDNTLLVCERASVELDSGLDLLPDFPVPEGYTHASWLRERVFEGARRRWGNELGADVVQRIEYELGIIEEMGFPAYFLIVADYIDWARRNGIRVGPGRGSAAGSAVAFSLEITQIDPLAQGLIFERFLNPGRKSLPDIDVDFDDRERGRVIDYVAEKYGRENVAQIVTFGRILAKQAVKDAARVLGYPYKMGDDITKLMPPPEFGRPPDLAQSLEKSKDLAELVATDPDVSRVYELARDLEGLVRQEGVHAAAVVMSRDPLLEHVPLAVTKNEARDVITQFEMAGCEEIGLLKMDFLGLRNLSVIEDALRLIERRGGSCDIDHVPLDDAATFDLLCRADTIGVFQLEGAPMRALIRQLQPTDFDDVVALVSLYRPGPMGMGMHTEYAERKNGRRPVTYPHADLEEALAGTYGVICYQEQVMEVARTIAGYSLPEADDFRKAMGKKKREIVARHEEKFVNGAIDRGYGEELGHELFETIRPFADYAFNKSHAACYGYIAYQTAYLKANYPAEYMSALLTSVRDDKDKPAVYLAETRDMGIKVLPPDVNRSDTDFSVVEDGVISYGLSAVRNVGRGVVESILAERDENGPFADFFDFARRVDAQCLNKRTVESLVLGGAFDAMHHSRKGLVEVHEAVIDLTLEKRRREDAGQFSLFDAVPAGVGAVTVELPPIREDEFDRTTKLRFEKEMLGLYVSDHPLRGLERALRASVEATIAEVLEAKPAGEVKWLGGVVVSADTRFTKNGDRMMILQVEDYTASAEVIVFASTLAKAQVRIEEDQPYLIKCRIDTRDEDVRLAALELARPDLSAEAKAVRVRINSARVTDVWVARARQILSSHPGNSPVYLHLRNAASETVVRLPDDIKVEARSGLFAELKAELGCEALLS